MSQLFRGGPKLDHVALGHQGEDLARGEEAVGREELVVGTRPPDPGTLDRGLPEAPA